MIRSVRLDAVLVQAVIAGALSFAHLHDLAAAAGQDGWKAWAYPVSVDLLLVAAWRRLRLGGDRTAAWCWFLVALVASLGANIATAGLLDLGAVPAWLRILVAGWPALAFLGGTLLAHSPTPHQPEPAHEPAPATPEPEPVPAPAVAESEPFEAPELGPAGPAPAPAVESSPAVPPALIDHARKLDADHRTTTGTPIDTATLRSRLGIPETLASAIVTQLA
ncbi:DUF2637 domain-containing protein [Streptomyces tubbatahanensis]|uniref:DUF2637 domain-containing protein n=1 Tax=Streptomyces tubbatahanensis TaxID=2923272 RepID=A0ABY3XXU1_9ACTN|nr:DUF2637 domain-containing protein [Streptomyces tubbatahanensis]UNS99242.1 DUF2637 domain-containing protein [Streptomyces tubbatahanensis]